MKRDNATYGVDLVLGGGGARGFAHVGVLEVLWDGGVPIRSIIGASAGALAGAAFAAGVTPDRMRARVIEYAGSHLARDTKLRSLVTSSENGSASSLVDKVGRLFVQSWLLRSFLMGPSVMGGQFFQESVDFFLPDARIEDLPLPFACVATDVHSGEPVVFDRGPLRKAVLASSAVPGIAPLVNVGGRWLMDGGVACLIPTACARRRGHEKIVAVNVDRDVFSDGIPDQALETYLRAGEIQSYHLARRMLRDADLVIEPDVGEVHWADFMAGELLMERGRAATRPALEQVRALLRPESPWRRVKKALGFAS